MPGYNMPTYNNINPQGFMPNAAWASQPMPNVYQPQASTQQPSSNLMTIFVNSEEEVLNYPVAAGLTVLLLSFNLKKFWLKSTNTNGVPQPIRVFPFTEEIQQSAQTTNNQNDSVTREEFRALNEKLEKLINDLGGGK